MAETTEVVKLTSIWENHGKTNLINRDWRLHAIVNANQQSLYGK